MKPDSNYSIWLADSPPAEVLSQTLGDALTEGATLWPDREAVVYNCQPNIIETRWTYLELNNLADRLAANILSQGFEPGDKIAIWGPNHPEWILLEYALAKAGLIIVALNPLYKRAELAYALNASDVVAIFHADTVGDNQLIDIIHAVKDQVPTLRGVYSFSSGVQELLAKEPALSHLASVAPDDILMIQYTSGTTGKPKAAQLTHSAITTTAKNSYLRWGFTEDSRVCHGFPLFHVGGSGNSIPGAALNGATTLPLYIFKSEQTLDILEQEKCTGFIGVPTMITAMLESPSFAQRDFSALKRIVLGGAQVPAYLIKRCEENFGVEVLNCYGQTETCGVTTSTVVSDNTKTKSESSGQPLSGVSVKITDASGEIVAHNVAGELCYKGPGRMLGYREKTDNDNAFDGGDWFKSGDLAKMTSSGYISIVGRSKEMIIRGGENLSPAEIENYLLEHPDVIDAAVIGLADEKYGEEACAVLRTNNENHASPAEIRAWCSERVSRWKVPKYIAFIDNFPATHSGKVKKFLLKELMSKHFEINTNIEENS
ncbi:class I adenylate-forming enzyme family protein [Zhongshania aquimaris]|uniref:AMP-binding protein n=1 Tax=Zhongshania aquimaris TaxID=2857107 RepID=A0ABS6VSR8_9GAMM|nr:AMP-binding protein [Zhongshania aquimaris]MBW2941360.1 AMP-binding protein [Zhongshania aquimaris]